MCLHEKSLMCSGRVSLGSHGVLYLQKESSSRLPLFSEESCSHSGGSATKGMSIPSFFHEQLSDPLLCGGLGETETMSCPARLCFAGSLVIPKLLHLLFNDGSLTWQWWK